MRAKILNRASRAHASVGIERSFLRIAVVIWPTLLASKACKYMARQFALKRLEAGTCSIDLPQLELAPAEEHGSCLPANAKVGRP